MRYREGHVKTLGRSSEAEELNSRGTTGLMRWRRRVVLDLKILLGDLSIIQVLITVILLYTN